MSTTMEEKPVSGSSQINPLGHLTRQQLKELEQREKTRGQKILDLVIMLLPVICGFIAVIEYWEVPNGSPNSHPYTYVWAVAAFMTAYALYALAAGMKYRKGDKRTAEDLRYRAPLRMVYLGGYHKIPFLCLYYCKCFCLFRLYDLRTGQPVTFLDIFRL